MRDEVEKLIVDWLKSDNENATYLAHQICVLLNVSVRCYVNIYKDEFGARYISQRGYPTYEEALNNKDKEDYFETVEVVRNAR